MRYLALGDSISIDEYTGVPHGGAASQFSRLIGASEVQDLTCDGGTTADVLEALTHVSGRPEVVTLTAGGNDFLLGVICGADPGDPEGVAQLVDQPLRNLALIADGLHNWHCPVIISTVYDPTDGDDRLAEYVGVPGTFREAFEALNEGIRVLARNHGFTLCDLQMLFRGHGIVSPDPWICQKIEPNYAGATAIAQEWLRLFRSTARDNSN